MGRRVLIADGNIDAAESLALVLQLHGHETQTAYSGPEAVESAAVFRPDTAFLSIALPKLDGYEVCRRLKADNGSWRPQLVVALTGCGMERERLAITAAGFDHYLLKPAEIHEILALLEAGRPS